MSGVDILVPDLPESVADATVATWHKKSGSAVVRDETLVEIEIDKVVLEAPTSTDGILGAVLEDEDTTITSRQILDRLRESGSMGKETSTESEERTSIPVQHWQASPEKQNNDTSSLAICRLLTGHNLDASAIKGTGVGGRLARENMEKHLAKVPAKESAPIAAAPAAQPALVVRNEKRVPMIRLRKRVAERLLRAKSSTTVSTTSNEIGVKPIMDLRKQCGEAFEKHHGIRLGFMSFYMKAVVKALKRYPEMNAPINDDDVVYHNYFDVSMATSTPCSLVMPILRDANTLGMVDIEKKIKELAVEGCDGKLTVEGLTGGNFTITNDGVFGSLISTPIINPPQSAVLSMCAIKDRPMAVNGQVEVLSMIYLALSYDHRLIDGYESTGFPVTIEELLEDPTHLLLDV